MLLTHLKFKQSLIARRKHPGLKQAVRVYAPRTSLGTSWILDRLHSKCLCVQFVVGTPGCMHEGQNRNECTSQLPATQLGVWGCQSWQLWLPIAQHIQSMQWWLRDAPKHVPMAFADTNSYQSLLGDSSNICSCCWLSSCLCCHWQRYMCTAKFLPPCPSDSDFVLRDFRH